MECHWKNQLPTAKTHLLTCSPCHFLESDISHCSAAFSNHVLQSMMETAAASPTNHFPAGLFSFCAEHRLDPRHNRPSPFQSRALCLIPPAQLPRRFWNSSGLF